MAKPALKKETKFTKINEVADTTINHMRMPESQTPQEEEGLSHEESQQLMEQRNFLMNTAKASFQQAKDSRRKYDQQWLARNLFWRGYQFSRYLPQTQTVVLSTRQSSRVPVNYMYSTMRAIANQVTSFRPKFEVLPASPTLESSRIQARYTQRLLDYYFDKLKLKRKTKNIIREALLYSVGGPWQIAYDEVDKEVKIWEIDPFDFFVDPLAEDYDDAEFMIKAVRRPMSEVTHNPNFNPWARREISMGDSRIAASEYKQFMVQAIKVLYPRINEVSSPMIILYEGYFKRRREDGTVYLVKCVWSEQNITPLAYEEIDQDYFDFVVYCGDILPKDIYGEGWAKHVMPINRALNSLETSAFEYNYRVAKGRLLVDRDAGVRAIHNVHGEIVSKNRGSEVKALDMAPLPVAVADQITRMWRYMEDISGIHEASLGRIPTGVKSGIGVAELKQADATSQDDLVDNLEDFLNEVAIKLLKKIAKNYDTYKVIRDLGIREGDEKYFVAIGKEANKRKKQTSKSERPIGREGQVKIGPDWFDVAEIGEDNTIRVTVGSWLGYTKEALQQKVQSYYQLGLIDQQTALRLLEFGDIDDIINRTRVQQVLQRAISQGPNQPGQPDQYSLATTENDMLLEGKNMPVSELDDHMVHIAVHQDALGRGADDIVGLHIDKHMVLAGAQGQTPSQGEAQAPQGQVPSAQPALSGLPGMQSPGEMGQLPQQNIQGQMNQLPTTPMPGR